MQRSESKIGKTGTELKVLIANLESKSTFLELVAVLLERTLLTFEFVELGLHVVPRWCTSS